MKNIEFRKASIDDMDLLFKWKNDKLALENGLNNKVVKYEEHKQWFDKKMKSMNTYIFIIYNEDGLIGQVRLDIEKYIGLISYSVDKKYRGMGFGSKIISEIEAVILNEGIKIKAIKAYVKKTNTASKKIFEKNKYIKEYEVEKDCYLYIKKL